MDHLFESGNDNLRNLAWLAFLAEERGYTELADAIVGETEDSFQREEELKDKISRLKKQREARSASDEEIDEESAA